MGRTLAVILHAVLSVIAGGLYFLFVLPRWWELNGDIPFHWGMVLRIVAGALIGLAALPVVFTWLRTRRPEYGTPQLALRLRVCSIVLHMLSAVLIIGTAISELWFSLDEAGRWLFGAYGAAAAVGLLAIFSFYLSFVAELPPPPPRPLKKKERKRRRRRKGGGEEAAAEETAEPEADDEDDVVPEKTWDEQVPDADEEEPQKPLTVEKSDDEEATAEAEASDDEKFDDDAPAAEDTVAAEAPRGGLRNRRPSGKIRRPRRLRKSDGGVAVDD